MLIIAASIEKNSEHPLAQAIVNEAKKQNLNLQNVYNFNALPGMGVEAELNNQKLLLGTKKLMAENNINCEPEINKINNLEAEGKTVLLVGFNGRLIGLIAVADILKEYAKETIKELHNLKIKTIMITGDNKVVGQAIAKQVNIDEVIAEVLPQAKRKKLKNCKPKAGLLPWSVTESTIRRLWRKPILA